MRPIELFFRFTYSRSQIDRELSYFIAPGTPALVQTTAKGSEVGPKTRWGIAKGMYREQVIFECPHTKAEFRSKSFAAFRLQDGLNYLQFLGLPEVETARSRVAIPILPRGTVLVRTFFENMSRAAPLGPDGRTRAEERKSGPRGAGSGLPRLRCHWFLEPRPRGLKIEPPLNRDEKRSLLLRLAEQDEHAQAQEWESLTWNGRRQLVGDALFSCNGLTEAQKKRHNDDPAFSVLMQIEVAQIRQQWSEQERRGQPAYRSRIQRLHAQQVAQEDKMLRGHIGSWRANAKTSAIDEPSGCGDCEHGQVNRKTCPALVAKGRSDAAREHLTSPGTDTRTRTGSNSIGKAT